MNALVSLRRAATTCIAKWNGRPRSAKIETSVFSWGATVMLEHLSSRIFAEQLNTTFSPYGPGSGGITPGIIGGFGKRSVSACRTILARVSGASHPHCPQGIYGVKHDKLGAFELFFVPLGPDPAGMRYQVIFCRLREEKNKTPCPSRCAQSVNRRAHFYLSCTQAPEPLNWPSCLGLTRKGRRS